ncbi:MAG TPA: hypothetical protein VFD60_09755 [Nitrososphaeraceae archaeon]|nr:hypothetical protein [Nitrososphaeraceae archaeon]
MVLSRKDICYILDIEEKRNHLQQDAIIIVREDELLKELTTDIID